MGRFLNADALASTGQGILGYNMFAYCNNNSANYEDKHGNSPIAISLSAVVALAATAIALPLLPFAIDAGRKILAQTISAVDYQIQTIASQAQKEIYEYSQSLQDSSAGMFENHQPRVHHIVPIGSFSKRDASISNMVLEMQNMLVEVGIDPVNDPINLMVLSHGYHKKLHTDNYITMMYNSLITARGDKTAITNTLYYCRIVIAFDDPYAYGF